MAAINYLQVIAVVLWAASIIMAVLTPNINVVVEVLGSLAAFFIFVFPGMCLLQLTLVGGELHSSTRSRGDVVLCFVAALYMIVGMFAFGLAFVLGDWRI
ncbi:hypothetical protein SK128_017078 [Halocaridina rubra]|uniref:Amino acid transporter transmembrane domain-containing protein n=1 Tax=Halocaridina rubra TaxID=373956 RepID=A0AAN8ZZU7_HALRR